MSEATGLARHDAGVSMSVSVSGLDAVLRLAAELGKAGTGAVPSSLAGRPAAIAAVLMTAAEMRVGPMEALRGIHMIEGKASLSSGLMLAQAIRGGVRVEWLEKSATKVRAKFTRSGFPGHEESYTIEEARTAGLANKGTWKSHPVAMLTARCISRALVSWAPDVLGAGVYVEGEIEEPTQTQPEAITVEVSDTPAPDLSVEVDAIEVALTEATSDAAIKAAKARYKFVHKRLTPEQRERIETAGLVARERVDNAAPMPPGPDDETESYHFDPAAGEHEVTR
jgi:hypothetical protein